MADHRLTRLAASFDNVDKVEDDAVFQPHDDVEVAQTDVRVNQYHFLPDLRQSNPKVGSRRRLADATFA